MITLLREMLPGMNLEDLCWVSKHLCFDHMNGDAIMFALAWKEITDDAPIEASVLDEEVQLGDLSASGGVELVEIDVPSFVDLRPGVVHVLTDPPDACMFLFPIETRTVGSQTRCDLSIEVIFHTAQEFISPELVDSVLHALSHTEGNGPFRVV